jgi:hypothetical protein
MHMDGDAYEDRSHSGSEITMPLMADEPLTTGDQAGAELNLRLVQHYRETEPRCGSDATSPTRACTSPSLRRPT